MNLSCKPTGKFGQITELISDGFPGKNHEKKHSVKRAVIFCVKSNLVLTKGTIGNN